jgi:hypothetical protein
MNGLCRMAGGCSQDALGTYRIAGIGDRGLCQVHVALLERMGMDFRCLDAPVVVPEWRRRLTAKDMTRSIA